MESLFSFSSLSFLLGSAFLLPLLSLLSLLSLLFLFLSLTLSTFTGIKIWVVTGDKSETAINIGYLSNLLTTDMTIFRIYDEEGGEHGVEEKITGALNHTRKHPTGKFAMVIDGRALHFALKYMRKEFLELGITCYSVLCTRANPIQKAKAVELVMEETKSICMAVGDGANDVCTFQFFLFRILFLFPLSFSPSYYPSFLIPFSPDSLCLLPLFLPLFFSLF